MNETERAALVAELAEAYYNANPITMCDAITDDGAEINRRVIKWDDLSLVQQASYRQRFYREFLFAMPIIDRLLAALAATTVDDDRIERAARAIHDLRPGDPEDCYEFYPDWDHALRVSSGTDKWTYAHGVMEQARAALAAAGTVPGQEQPDLTTAYLLGESRGRDAATAPGLDELLDSVHPNAAVHVWLESEPEPEVGLPHYFMARLDTNGPNTGEPAYGTGPTRMDAIRNAVAQATGTAMKESERR